MRDRSSRPAPALGNKGPTHYFGPLTCLGLPCITCNPCGPGMGQDEPTCIIIKRVLLPASHQISSCTPSILEIELWKVK